MKKIILGLIVMTAFLAAALGVSAETPGSMDIRDRLAKPELNIIDTGTIIFMDSENNIIQNPDINSKVKIKFEWSLLNEDAIQIQDGDTYTFQLPDSFRIPNNMNISLGDYGTATINTNRTVIITFSDQVALHSNVNGYIEFEARLNADGLDDPGPQEILLPINGEANFTFTLVPTTRDTSIDKDGDFDRYLNPASIEWKVTINKAYETLTNVVINDTMPAGLTLEAIEVYPVNLNQDGTFKNYGDQLEAGEYQTNGANVTLGTISQPYEIRYLTTINDNIKPDDGGDISFRNQVQMTSTENGAMPAEATLIASYGKLLSKNSPAYSNLDQTFTWTVDYNYGEKTLVNPILLDTFDEDLDYVTGSFKITDANGTPLTYDYTLTQPAGNQIQIQFNQTVDKPIKLIYSTKVKTGHLITENETFTNTIQTAGKTSGNTGTATPQMILKSTTGINYATRDISWAIDINRNQYQISDYTLTDVYVYKGLTLIPGSFIVRDVTNNSVINASDYTLTINTQSGAETGFTLVMKNAYAQTSSRLRVEFKTAYNHNDLVGATNLFRNQAILDWTDQYGNDHQHSSQSDRNINSETRLNGKKGGSYNAVSKEITWITNINYNDEDYDDPIMTDAIAAGQNYVPGSLTIREYTVNPNGSTTPGNLVDTGTWTIEYPSTGNNQTLTIQFPETPGIKYQIQYRTSLEGEVIARTYTNRAVFANGPYTRNLDASVSVRNGSKMVTKSGAQQGSQINWSIAINESQSTIEAATLNDVPSINQILLEDSFKLYPVIVSANESYTIDRANPLVRNVDYTLNIMTDQTGQQTFELKFLDRINRTYVLEYTSEISTTPDNTTISNSVRLSGNEVTYTDDNGNESIVIDISSAGGGAVGVKGSLTIRKVDDQGNPLQGVHFDLYNPLNRKIASSETDENGLITYRNLVYGNYTIKETQTLEGFIISDELFNGTRVVVNGTSSIQGNYTEFVNHKNKLEISKYTEGGDLLDGSVFTLEQKVNNTYTVVATGIAVQAGKITIEGLEAGEYRLLETQAPSGYVRNTTPLEFEITLNANQQEQDAQVRFVNYQGSVELSKTDGTGAPLAGALFNLYDASNKLIQEGLETDDDGKIAVANLAPGNYTFVETKSAGGNIINETPIPFTIASESAGRPEAAEVASVNSKGSVEFYKKNEDQQALSGVGFDLYKLVDGQEVKVGEAESDDDGKVAYSNLEPGSYRFRETDPKAGYLLNTTPIDFAIPERTTQETLVITLDDFINYQGSVELQKLDGSQTPLEGVLYDLYDESQQLIHRDQSTDADGKVRITGLKPGNYTFIERKSAGGNIVNETPIPFTIAAENAGEPEVIGMDATNSKGRVEFIKTNEAGRPLPGVFFDLYRVSGNLEVKIGMTVSDLSGRISIGELEPGDYRLREAIPSLGYIRNTTPIDFVIPEKTTDEIVVVELSDYLNYQGSVELVKTGSDQEPLEGALFNLYTRDHHLLMRNLRTDADGKITVDNLAPGRYTFVETKSAGGNILNDTPIPFVIAYENAGKPETVKVYGTNSKGSVVFTKTDAQQQPVAGAVFELYKLEDGREVKLTEVLSDLDGIVETGNLEPGKYRFREAAALKEYIVNTTPIDFEIPERSREEAVIVALDEFINYQGSITLTKVDTKGYTIGEAVFSLFAAGSNEFLGSYRTENGSLAIKNLKPGAYELIEMEAPEGYLLNQTPVSFEIPESYEGAFQTLTLEKENRKKGILPKTGQGLLVMTASVVLVASGSLLLLIGHKRKG